MKWFIFPSAQLLSDGLIDIDWKANNYWFSQYLPRGLFTSMVGELWKKQMKNAEIQIKTNSFYIISKDLIG